MYIYIYIYIKKDKRPDKNENFNGAMIQDSGFHEFYLDIHVVSPLKKIAKFISRQIFIIIQLGVHSHTKNIFAFSVCLYFMYISFELHAIKFNF